MKPTLPESIITASATRRVLSLAELDNPVNSFKSLISLAPALLVLGDHLEEDIEPLLAGEAAVVRAVGLGGGGERVELPDDLFHGPILLSAGGG